MSSRWLIKDNPYYSPFDGSPPQIQVCAYCGFEHTSKREYMFCPVCGEYMSLYSLFTNGDRIREMTDDQLVKLFTAFEYDGKPFFTCPAYVENHDCVTTDCRECFLKWLKQEADHGL